LLEIGRAASQAAESKAAEKMTSDPQEVNGHEGLNCAISAAEIKRAFQKYLR
jgi:hypothetical protein